MLQTTGTISDRELQEQTLDDMDLERERGITIKSHAIQMNYKGRWPRTMCNLIDTPGHVDFSYEVSRSIAACEGALLIVDATQGIEAQTISNLYLALEHDLEIIPVLNKMDLDSADRGGRRANRRSLAATWTTSCPRPARRAWAWTTFSRPSSTVCPPRKRPSTPLQAMIFDSVFNSFRGIIAYFRVLNGTIKKGDKVKFMATGREYDADEIGILGLDLVPKKQLAAGDVGYIISGIKNAKEVKVGDTLTAKERPCTTAVKGFEDVKPMVFAGIYPVDTEDYEELRNSMEKLQLNDASLVFEPESSAALGFGFRCGFLGMLHMEIIQERLEREFNMTVITTVPNVGYKAYTKKGEKLEIMNPSDLPDANHLDYVEEPFIKAKSSPRANTSAQS